MDLSAKQGRATPQLPETVSQLPRAHRCGVALPSALPSPGGGAEEGFLLWEYSLSGINV